MIGMIRKECFADAGQPWGPARRAAPGTMRGHHRATSLRQAALVLMLVVLLTAPLMAQRGDERIDVRFVAQAAPSALGQVVMVAGETVSEGFTLPLHHLTEPQRAPGRSFGLAREQSGTPLATVTLPDEGDDFVVLLVVGAGSSYEAVVIPYRSENFRPGDFYLHNVSRRPVLGRVGSLEFNLNPRQGRVLRPAGARDGRLYDVTLAIRDGEGVRPLSQSRWPVATHTRTYVFFYHDPVRNDVSFRAVDEFVPDE